MAVAPELFSPKLARIALEKLSRLLIGIFYFLANLFSA
jgi:hypothetical protein